MDKIIKLAKNNIIFVELIFAFIFLYFIYSPSKKNYDGCHEYAINLANCESFTCEQYLRGFKNRRAGREDKLSKRIILGWDQKEHGRICKVAEIDDLESETITYNCEYKESDLPKLVNNAAILFGSKTPEVANELKGDVMDAYRIKYYERSKIQKGSCQTLSSDK